MKKQRSVEKVNAAEGDVYIFQIEKFDVYRISRLLQDAGNDSFRFPEERNCVGRDPYKQVHLPKQTTGRALRR